MRYDLRMLLPGQPRTVAAAILPDSGFANGIIEVDLTGDVLPAAVPDARGFTGIAFRMSADGSKYEASTCARKMGEPKTNCSGITPRNIFPSPSIPGRGCGRKHRASTKVTSTWSPANDPSQDRDPGRQGPHVRAGSAQPTLIVNDLKHGQSKGSIALWIGPDTIAHFSNLRITRR